MKTSKKHKTEHDDAAFGIPEDENGARRWGLTVREYFAGQILAGFAAAPMDGLPHKPASVAVDWADWLIQALNSKPFDPSPEIDQHLEFEE